MSQDASGLLAFLQPQLLRLFLSFISAYQSTRLHGLSDELAPSPLEGLSIATFMFLAAVVQFNYPSSG